MKRKLLVSLMIFVSLKVISQELHTDSNASSILNEANATVGWNTLNGSLLSVNENDVHHGLFSLELSYQNSGGDNGVSYTFPAIIGEEYRISIWAKLGSQSSDPAFVLWNGFSQSIFTSITSTTWTEYVFIVTAISATPRVKLFVGSGSNGNIGDSILFDSISIVSTSFSDTEAPSAVTDASSSNTTQTTTDLSWTASTDNVGVADYEVFEGVNSLGLTGGATTFNVTGLTASTSYSFSVVAIDGSDNRSGAGNVVDVTTLDVPDTEAPSAVTDASSSNTTQTTTDLSWTASTDNVGVADYEVFEGVNSLGLTGGATTFNVTGLTASTSYSFSVVAIDGSDNRSGAGNVVDVTTLDVPDTEAPSAVTDASSSNTTQTTTDLSWTASTDNVGVADYEVFEGVNSLGLTGGATTFNVTGLTASTSYSFSVVAIDGSDNRSGAGNVVDVTTLDVPDTEAPSAVTDASSSNTTQTTTDLSWTASTDNVGVADYEVFEGVNSLGLTGGATTFNVTGLTASTSYSFSVVAIDGSDNRSGAGNVVDVTTLDVPDTEAPSAVTDASSSNTTQTTTDLSWTASTDNVGVADYEVFEGVNSLGLTGGATTFNVTGLTASTSYSFSVVAIDGSDNRSGAGNVVDVTTLDVPDTEAPSAVTDASSSNTTQTTTDLSWTASTDNVGVADYEVFEGVNSLGLTGGATTFNVTGLTASTSYSFSVVAIDGSDNRSGAGNVVDVTTLDVPDTEAPSAVTDASSSNTTQTTTDLSWTASTDNVGVADYEVFEGVNSLGLTGGATTFNVTGLTASTSYSFSVVAIDGSDNRSGAGNVVDVTTLDDIVFTDYTSLNSNLSTFDWTARDLFADRNIGIGTTDTQGYRLAVAGGIVAESVKVELQTNWPDFVFMNNYNLPTLKQVEEHIKEYGHLIGIPNAQEIEKDGIDLGLIDAKLLQKIEELTLYLIQQEKEIFELKKENEEIKELIRSLISKEEK